MSNTNNQNFLRGIVDANGNEGWKEKSGNAAADGYHLCSWLFTTVPIDSWIKQIIATGNKEKAAIKAQGWKDCKIYRDGEKNGVVYEYIGAPAQDAQLKLTDENLLKQKSNSSCKRT